MKTRGGGSLALLTDLYQLTMAYGYWREGLAHREAVFHHFFRKAPFGGKLAIAAGLETALDWLEGLRFREDDLDYLASLVTRSGRSLFEQGFLDYLRDFSFECSVDAVPEGTVVFAQEPIVRVRGPLLHGQLIETGLLNIVNFQTLVATKAARVCQAAGDRPVLEFGLRRAQGIDGGTSASRAAYIGGCAATSNVLAGKLHGIPVRGTHAHSWVLAFGSEREAFSAFARAMPHNCVLLVDTYDTMEGVRRAIEVGLWLKERGHELAGIRLDSGDLAALSVSARELLDRAGLHSTAVVASNDLDEQAISRLRQAGGQIAMWGVGTSIVTGKGAAALTGVYKLALLRDPSREWLPKAKRSEEPSKASIPGMLQTRRFFRNQRPVADVIFDQLHVPEGRWTGFPTAGGNCEESIRSDEEEHEDLLRPVLRGGRPVRDPEALEVLQRRCRAQLSSFPGTLAGGSDESEPPVLLEAGLSRRRSELLARMRRGVEGVRPVRTRKNG